MDLLSPDVNAVLEASDFVVNTLPSTPATKGLLAGSVLSACGQLVHSLQCLLCRPGYLPLHHCNSSRANLVSCRMLGFVFAATAERKQSQRLTTFINVGRGDIMGEQDVITALDSGWIGQAVLDVFPVEPLPAESPVSDLIRLQFFWSNVIFCVPAGCACCRANATFTLRCCFLWSSSFGRIQTS